MNYFSHYYFDHQKEMEIHNLGLVLPDMVRNFIRGKKLFPDESPVLKSELEQLRIGTNKHFSRDKIFHSSEYFEAYSKKITTLIKPVFEQAAIPRYWFAAHVLMEMLIDRVLILENPVLADQFYKELEITETALVEEFLRDRKIEETELFIQRFARFNQAKYLLHYVHDKAIVYSLNRIFMYTGADTEWTVAQSNLLENLMPEAESIIFESLLALKQEMN